MNIILLASGRGTRLRPETVVYPKPLVKVGKKRIVDYFIDATEAIKIKKNIFIATGYQHTQFDNFKCSKIFNPFFETTNMLFGLWNTLSGIANYDSDTIISYGDIIFPNDTLNRLVGNNEMCILVDSNWRNHYVGRTEHGFTECEKCILDNNQNLLIASKHLPEEYSNYKEFVGIFYIPKRIISEIKHHLNLLFDLKENLDKPFMFSSTLRKSYLTDLFSYLIINNFKIKTIEINGQWSEIDTLQDLQKARGFSYV